MWAATLTRQDISFAAHNLAKFCDNSRPVHWKAAMKALRNFLRTKDLAITYGGDTSRGLTTSAYVDFDHATCPDSRRSVSGGAVVLGGGTISWFSRAQKVKASASSGSEYVALAEIVNETKFLRQVQEFHHAYSEKLYDFNHGRIIKVQSRWRTINTAAEECATSTSSTTLFETPSRRDWSALFMLGVKSNMQTYLRRL